VSGPEKEYFRIVKWKISAILLIIRFTAVWEVGGELKAALLALVPLNCKLSELYNAQNTKIGTF